MFLEFDTYNPDIVIGTDSWFSEEISNAQVFKADYTTFRIAQTHLRWWSVCVKNYITCAELWIDEVYEMILEQSEKKISLFSFVLLNHNYRNCERRLTKQKNDVQLNKK